MCNEKVFIREFAGDFTFCVFITATLAPGKMVSGTVTNDNGNILSCAIISVKHTTATNPPGLFTINVPANGRTLVVNYGNENSNGASVMG